MNKSQIIETFNNHFIEFMNDIELVVPADKEIIAARKSITKGLIFNSKMVIKSFIEHFSNIYGNEIENGDLNFFVNSDYKTNITLIKNKDAISFFEKIDCLRVPIKNMNENEKQNVIKYLQNLKKIGELYINLKKSN